MLLTGGAIQSPQLLLLSGIGPAEELKAVGVEPKIDRPGVGSNLQDQPAVGRFCVVLCWISREWGRGTGRLTDPSHPLSIAVVAHDITQRVSVTDQLFLFKDKVKPHHLVRWLTTGRGILTTPGCDHGAFVKTDPSLPEADLQVNQPLPYYASSSRYLDLASFESIPPSNNIQPIQHHTHPNHQLRFVAARGQDPDGVRSYIQIGDKGHSKSGLTVQVVNCRAKSQGKVSLASKDPLKKPRIECRYLSDAADLQSLRSGLRLARTIVQQPAFQDVLGPEVFPGPNVQSDADLDAYIRESLHTANALVGTCRMGRPDDKGAVVDPTLRVIGAQNLRVVDASVMPSIPGGQTGASTTMIAERAADLIRAAHGDFVEAGVGGQSAK